MQKKLAVYCCGGVGREIALYYKSQNKYDEVIFIDDNPPAQEMNSIHIYTYDEFVNFDLELFDVVVTSGEPSIRRKIFGKLQLDSIHLPCFYISDFFHYSDTQFSDGCIIHFGSTITCNVTVGFGTFINKHVVIGHDVVVGDFCVVSPNSTIGGNVIINDDCFIGSGAIIKNGITIGKNSIIGMGAVVIHDVPENSVVVGNPATKIRENATRKVF